MCGGGGGGGGGRQAAPAPPPVRKVKFTDALGREQTVLEDDYGKTTGLNPISAGTKWASILANPAEASKYRQMAASGEMLYPGGQKPPTASLASLLGQTATAGTKVAPITQDRRASVTTGLPVEGFVPQAGRVTRQDMPGDYVGGGEVGVGDQGFGKRALSAGEAEIVQSLGPMGTPEQGTLPTEIANSDLQLDPNTPVLTPTGSVVPDVNYIVPTSERTEQQIAFYPNDPNAAYVARGPISQNLRNRRTGWGSAIDYV